VPAKAQQEKHATMMLQAVETDFGRLLF